MLYDSYISDGRRNTVLRSNLTYLGRFDIAALYRTWILPALFGVRFLHLCREPYSTNCA